MKRLSSELRRSLESSTEEYESQLSGAENAVSYLAGRGISMETAAAFRLGFVDRPLEGHDQWRGFITIPYLRPAGVVAMKFRRIDEGEPRYLNFPGCGTHLFNTEALRSVGEFVGLCEGEFDGMVLSGPCGIPSSGVPGVTQWKAHDEWRELFEGRKVLMFPDVDRKKEGEDPGATLAQQVQADLDSVRVVRLPEPEGDETKTDVTSVFLKYGREEIRRLAGL